MIALGALGRAVLLSWVLTALGSISWCVFPVSVHPRPWHGRQIERPKERNSQKLRERNGCGYLKIPVVDPGTRSDSTLSAAIPIKPPCRCVSVPAPVWALSSRVCPLLRRPRLPVLAGFTNGAYCGRLQSYQ